MSRKIIQIAVSPGAEDLSDLIYGLCDDGTLWCALNSSELPDWELLPPVPQRKLEKD